MATLAPACVADVEDDPEAVSSTEQSFEAFERTVYREPDTGIYIVDGDTPVLGVKRLREFWETYVRDGALIVQTQNGSDVVWTASQKKNISYCVSTTFGNNYNAVVAAMASATGAWESAADVDFIHVSSQDSNCTANNSQVVFDVRPVNSGGQYLARAFFPNDPREASNVLIDGSAFGTDPTLEGVLRHELGHTLGFRHEHTRLEAGWMCYEDDTWRALTPYDRASVMHYPDCNGTYDWSLLLTASDKSGAQSLYGAPGGGTGGDTGGGTSGGTSGGTKTETYSGSIARSAFRLVGQTSGFPVVAGSKFKVVMTGTNDPDLYVKFGASPSTSSFGCRPFLDGASETCELDVPVGQQKAYVAVRGYTAATYSVTVTYTAP
ncbi:M57 family metalloprotease [Sorangium sp. So ce260]|uniref:M57 family metalloprotease n=1 Tax=Sorangium sp. So ce260 TaxID=3133291 RepID=UPI003F607897